MNQWDREEDQLVNDLNAGRISRDEYNKQMSALRRDYQDSAREAAQEAYEREMDQW